MILLSHAQIYEKNGNTFILSGSSDKCIYLYHITVRLYSAKQYVVNYVHVHESYVNVTVALYTSCSLMCTRMQTKGNYYAYVHVSHVYVYCC